MSASMTATVEPVEAQHVRLQAESAPSGAATDEDDPHIDLIRRTVSAVAAACVRRLPTGVQLRGFRVLAVRCALSGITLDDARAIVRLYARRPHVLVVARGARPTELSSVSSIAAARQARHRAADAIVERIEEELVSGYAAVVIRTIPAFERGAQLRAALDGGPTDPYGPDSDILRAVAVLFGRGDDLQHRLDLAGEAAAILVPGALDVGPTPDPMHRRVVFAGWSARTWREASEILAAIGDRYDLVVRTTAAVRGLRQLSTVYRELIDSVPGPYGVNVLRGPLTPATVTA